MEHKRRNVCLGVTAAVIILLILLMVVLGFTVFKAKHPVTTMNSITLQNLRVGFNIAKLSVTVNVTVDVDLAVYNPNKVGFKYSNSSALLNYRGEQVGQVPITASRISAGETKPMNVTLTLMADRLLSNSKLYSDAISGTLPFNTFTRLSGKVIILNIFKVHVVSSTSCDFLVFVSNRSIGAQTCTYKTKL